MVDLIAIKKMLEPQLTKVEGVVGVSVDLAKNKLIVYVESRDAVPKIKPLLVGIPVEYKVVGRVTI